MLRDADTTQNQKEVPTALNELFRQIPCNLEVLERMRASVPTVTIDRGIHESITHAMRTSAPRALQPIFSPEAMAAMRRMSGQLSNIHGKIRDISPRLQAAGGAHLLVERDLSGAHRNMRDYLAEEFEETQDRPYKVGFIQD